MTLKKEHSKQKEDLMKKKSSKESARTEIASERAAICRRAKETISRTKALLDAIETWIEEEGHVGPIYSFLPGRVIDLQENIRVLGALSAQDIALASLDSKLSRP